MPASAGQRLLWFLDRYRGAGGALNCPMVCRIGGPLDTAALEAALDGLAARHESLRTTFEGAGRNLVQVIHPPGPLPLEHAGAGTGAAVDEALTAELRTRIDPVERPVRARLWRISPGEHVLCLNMHHLVTDTWSCDVLFRDLAAGYAALLGEGPPPPPVGWQYAQYALWQERSLGRGGFRRHEEYWKARLAGVTPPALPLKPGGGGGRRLSELVEAAGAGGLRELAAARRTTVFAVLLAVYYALLHRTTGQHDLAVASLFANRTRPEVQRTVGFLANLLVLRTSVPPRATFADLVDAARTTVLDASAHQRLPFHLLPQATARGGPVRLDDVVFQLLAEPLDAAVRAGGVEFRGLVPDVAGRFDFELALMPRGRGFAAKLFYAEDRADPAWARGFAAEYARLAAAAAADPSRPVTAL
ncbi:condensation domain-containing protein [Bailinhaonella thermotolerans]|uniref:condensation domain-containing protein n=1 Tax=Bailinhaonella thermotolerans TaxID=1070861 RepID=UPI00192A3256|nr:condensation domain-containing protein [Bailinhaonella thermotolerans]